MLIRNFLLLLFFLLSSAYAAEERVFSLSFGPVQIGQARVPVAVNDFEIIQNIRGRKLQAELLPESVQWVRGEHNILSPRALLSIVLEGSVADLQLHYMGRNILLQDEKEGATTTLYISLFYPEVISVYEKGKMIGEILVKPKPEKLGAKRSKLIDYSCAPYSLQVEGAEEEYLSVSCHLGRRGRFLEEKPLLEVSWTATNMRLLDGSPSPYHAVLKNSSPVVTKVKSSSGKETELRLKAQLPERLPRLKLAMGLGPYSFSSEEKANKQEKVIAPAGMLYANFLLTEESSLRAFDALVARTSLFNNAGLYFAYELARPFDGRLDITALLGFQGLSYRYKPSGSLGTQIIYPQGFELTLKHFWGIENTHLTFGMFLSPSKTEDYNNLWVRYGRKVFWELNYISWANEDKKAKMLGFSVGFPLASFF